MRRTRIAWLALCLAAAVGACARPAWELPPPPARDAPVVQPGALTRAELPNGLRFLYLEDKRLPRIALGVALRRGEAGVGLERAGLAPFAAEVMRRGAGARDALALAQAVDEIGASLSVGSGWDSMSVTVSGLSRDFDRLLEILADVVLRPRFDRAEAERARSELLAALERALDQPDTLAAWNLSRVLFSGHRFGLPRSGTPETVARLDARLARDFHRRQFVANNAIFAGSGSLAPELVLERMREAFGSWKRGDVPEAGEPPPRPAPEGRRVVIVDRPELEQAQIRLAHGGIARTDPQRIPAQLMNTVLGGGGFSSRLMGKVRAEEGLAYGVYSSFSLRRQPGPFRVSTSTRVPEARRVVDLLLAELRGARSAPPSDAELRDARTLTLGRFSMGLETSEAVVDALVDLDIYGLPEDSLDTYRRRVRAVTVEDTARMARQLLHPERVAVVLVGPAEALRPQFVDLAPVEVVLPD